MKSIHQVRWLILGGMLVALPALAQNATTTRSTNQITPAQPAATPVWAPAPRQMVNPITTPPPAGPIPNQLGQRATQPAIEVRSPTQSSNSPAPRQDDPAHAIGAQPARVYDRNGLPLNGMEQVGPNRVRDPRTGRFYDTRPSGDGQLIVP